MAQWTIAERVFLVRSYFENKSSIVDTQREFRRNFNVQDAPSEDTIKRYIASFQEEGTVRDKPTRRNSSSIEEKTPTMADTDAKRKGRPKKRDSEVVVIEAPTKKAAVVSNGDDAAPPAKRGRGRPPKAGSVAAPKKVPLPGRGRGRPPKNTASKKKKKESEDEADDNEEDEKDESADEVHSS